MAWMTPVGVDGHAHRCALVARVPGRQQVLAAVFDPLHRPAEDERRERHRALLAVHEHLLAEAAADVARGHAHVAVGNLQVAGEEVAGLVHRLAGADDVELVAAGVVRRDDAARLHRHRDVAVLHHVALDDVRGVGERVVEVGGERHEGHRRHRVGLEAPARVHDVLGVGGGDRVVDDRLSAGRSRPRSSSHASSAR